MTTKTENSTKTYTARFVHKKTKAVLMPLLAGTYTLEECKEMATWVTLNAELQITDVQTGTTEVL